MGLKSTSRVLSGRKSGKDHQGRSFGRLAGMAVVAVVLAALVFPATAAWGSGAATRTDFQKIKKEALGGMNLYFGNLHSHTAYSDGKGTPEQAFLWARDVAGMDFYAVTDHSILTSSSQWRDTGEKADWINENGRFAAIRGFEWSNPLLGHVNVFNTAGRTNTILSPTMHSLYRWLHNNGGFGQFNHPGREWLVFDDFNYFGDTFGQTMSNVETGNKDTGNNDSEFYSKYLRALEKGWRLSPTSGQDNHKLSANSHRTAVACPDLSRESVLEAVEGRRTYSTDDPNLEIIFKNENEWMGSSVERKSGEQSFDVVIQDDEEISKLELVTGGGRVVAKKEFAAGSGSTKVVWNPKVNVRERSYYFLKVTERDTKNDDHARSGTQVALTAPIWFDLIVEEGQLPPGQWYKGDLHSHSTYSDGDSDVPSVLSIAKSKGFDYFVLTDHGTVAQWNDPGYTASDMSLLYGVEWTTGNGHANIWSEKPFDWSRIEPTMKNGDARSAIDATHSQAAGGQRMLFSINHPNALTCAWKSSFEASREADSMEVWNSRFLWPNFNNLSLGTADEYARRGKQIAMVGGSDSHAHKQNILDPINYIQTLYHDLGIPTTWVYARSNSGRDVLEGIGKGHTSISLQPEGPRLELLADPSHKEGEPLTCETMMGDAIPSSALGKKIPFRVRVSEAYGCLPAIVVVKKNGNFFKAKMGYKDDFIFDFTDTPRKGDFYRVQLHQLTLDLSANPITNLIQLTQLGWVVAVTSPIYTWSNDPTVGRVTPASGGNDGVVEGTELTGTRFQLGATVELRKIGRKPIRAENVTVASPEKITCRLDLDGASPGLWDVVVTNPNGRNGVAKGVFEVIKVDPPAVGRITPSSAGNDAVVEITELEGARFKAGAKVELRKDGSATIEADGVTVASPEKITCRFDLDGASPGLWDAVVTNPNNMSGVAQGAFEVVEPRTDPDPETEPEDKKPSKTWYIAEGATLGGFETWVVLQNPGEEEANVRINYQTDSGEVNGDPVTIAPGSRKSINVGEAVQSYNVSTTIDSDRPVVAERSIYANNRTCAHGSIGYPGN